MPIKLKVFYKQIVGAEKNVSSMKILAELGRTLLEINIEKIQLLFKYFQRFYRTTERFIEKDTLTFKAFQEVNLVIDGWVKYMKTILKLFRLDNLMRNICKVVSEEILKKNYENERDFQLIFIKCYIAYEKERYLNLKKFEIRKAIPKLKLSSNKLEMVTGKSYKTKTENRLSNLCNLNSIEDEFHFSVNCPNYKQLWEIYT